MRPMSNITSFTMMMIVLLLGVFMPSLPNLDDGDDNVGCAAVMPLSTQKSSVEAARAQQRQCSSKRNHEIASVLQAMPAAVSGSTTVIAALSQVSPPLRP